LICGEYSCGIEGASGDGVVEGAIAIENLVKTSGGIKTGIAVVRTIASKKIV
jgi:hypothetical protein